MRRTVFFRVAAVATVVLSAPAAAETSVYGKLHLSFGNISEKTSTSDTSTRAVASHASRIGFKSSDDFGDGLKGVVQAEFEVDAAGDTTKSSTDLIKLRNTYAGLEGGFGLVRIGNFDTPHKVSTAKLDPFTDTYADYNNIIALDTRLANSIGWSAKFGGLAVALQYGAGADKVGGENAGDVTAAIENHNDAAAGDLDGATVIGASYKLAELTLGAAYQTEQYQGGSDVNDTYVSAMYKLGDANAVNAAWGSRDLSPNAATMMAVGFDHKFDKRAMGYVMYASGQDGGLSNKGKLAGDGSALVVGYQYKF